MMYELLHHIQYSRHQFVMGQKKKQNISVNGELVYDYLCNKKYAKYISFRRCLNNVMKNKGIHSKKVL